MRISSFETFPLIVSSLLSQLISLNNSYDNMTHMKPLWRLVCRRRGPERIRTFLWLVIHNRAMTNEIRYKRHMNASPVEY